MRIGPAAERRSVIRLCKSEGVVLPIGDRSPMGNWDTKLSARTVRENLCACEPRAMLGSRSPVA